MAQWYDKYMIVNIQYLFFPTCNKTDREPTETDSAIRGDFFLNKGKWPMHLQSMKSSEIIKKN